MRSPLGRCSSKARTIQLAMIVNNTVSERKECEKVYEFQLAYVLYISAYVVLIVGTQTLVDLLKYLVPKVVSKSKIVAKSKDLSIFKLNTLHYTKAELLQLNHTQFICLRKVGNQKNYAHYIISTFKTYIMKWA